MKSNEKRRDQLNEIFKNVDEAQKQLIDPLLDELVRLEDEIAELRKLPQLRVHPNNPSIQKLTPAARLLKMELQSYMNAVRILSGILRKIESTTQDELLEALKQFEI
ncbi:MAG: hypothetical protein IIZ07_08655 [Ruminococcus sp.]|nr:hypothetical protein [Ruminococcus sp.]